MYNKLINGIAIASMMFIAISCSQRAQVEIDNPTKEKLTVIIDEKDTISLLPDWTHSLTNGLTNGQHTLRIGEKIDTFHINGKKILLNPTFSRYVAYDETYGSYLFSPKFTSITSAGIVGKTFGDKFVKGPIYQLDSMLVIDFSNVDYGLGEQFPESVEIRTSRNNSLGASTRKGKIFRRTDFLDYILNQSEKEMSKDERAITKLILMHSDLNEAGKNNEDSTSVTSEIITKPNIE